MVPRPRSSYSSCLLLPVVLGLVSISASPVLLAQSSVFNGPRNYPVGTLTYNCGNIAVADFNGDGLPDIAVANNASNNVSVLLQNPDGTFQPAVNYPVGNQPYSVQAADVNGDGKPDLVLVNSGDNTLGVLMGNGNGTFQAQLTTALPVTGSSSNSIPFVVTGDWNGDGKADVAVAGTLPQAGDYAFAVMLSNGDGTFQTPATYSLTAVPFALNTADFNNDGKPDLVTAASGGVSVWLGNGDGTFQTAVFTASSQQIMQGSLLVIADFNQDGKLDIATATFGIVADEGVSEVTLFLGNGEGGFQVQLLSSFLMVPWATGDLNGDGKPDLIGVQGAGQLGGATILLNTGNATFIAGPTVELWPSSAVPGPTPITLADLNGDQKLDLVTSLNASFDAPSVISVLDGNGDGTFAQFPMYGPSNPQQINPIVAADFNNDGKPDLAEAFIGPEGYLNIGVLLNNGAGFSPPVDTAITLVSAQNLRSTYVAAGDFNNDGNLDAALAALTNLYNGGIYVLLGNGNGTFQTAVEYGSSTTGPLVVADFNGDGNPDILGVATTEQAVSVLLGTGKGTFGFPVTTPFATGGGNYDVFALAVADFNGDGKLDVAALVLNGSTAPLQLIILLGNGDGTFTLGATYTPGTSPESLVIGDMNGDGIPDIVVGNSWVGSNPFASSVVVLLGNGDGTFQAPITTTAGNGNYSIAVADFNLDGKADVALGDTGWSDVSLLLGNGNGTFQPPMQSFVGNSFGLDEAEVMLAVADFDGNGSPDLAVSGENGISVLLNTAGGRTPTALLSTGTLAFGNEAVGQTASPQTVTLSYMASTALTISSIAISGAQSGDFSQTNSCGTSLAAGLGCTIKVTFTPPATGARTAAIQIADNAPNSPQVINLSGTGTAAPSIGLGVPSGSSSSVTVTAGQTASYTLSIGGAGMSGSASLTCTGAPKGAICSVPSSVTISGTAASTVKVSVTTTSRTMTSVNLRRLIPFGGAWAAVMIAILLAPPGWRSSSRKRHLGALVVAIMLLCSCGSNSPGGSTSPTGSASTPNGTPAGTYTITVTATLNSATEITTLGLQVQ